MTEARLTLKNAIESDRLGDFIAQAEADGIGPAAEADVQAVLCRVITSPSRSSPASRSPRRDGSREK